MIKALIGALVLSILALVGVSYLYRQNAAALDLVRTERDALVQRNQALTAAANTRARRGVIIEKQHQEAVHAVEKATQAAPDWAAQRVPDGVASALRVLPITDEE